MFNLKSTSLIILVLFIPFLVKLFFKKEFYPAVILPAGHTVVHLKEKIITTTSTSIFAIADDGRQYSVSIPRLFEPIPNLYSNYIYDNDFGIGRIIPPKGDVIDISGIDTQNVIELKDWLARKFKEQRIKSTIKELRLVTYEVTVSIEDGSQSRKAVNEKTIKLLK